MNSEEIIAANKPKFDLARSLRLPLGRWAITSSGPLGARGMRPINDVDIIVDPGLWEELVKQYGTKEVDGRLKINVPSELLDISGYATYPDVDHAVSGNPSMEQQISEADIIDGLPFVSLGHIRHFKAQQGRDKDRRDIEMIDEYVRTHKDEGAL